MNATAILDREASSTGRSQTLRVVLPGYRGPFAANDFNNLEVREIDNAVTKYLNGQSNRIPWGFPRRLVLEIPEERDPQREKVTAEAYRDLFRYQARAYWHSFLQQIPLSAALVFIALIVFLISHYLSDSNLEEHIRKTLSDAVQVGGWVAMWTAIAAIFSDGFDSLQNYFTFRRLARIEITFEYTDRLE